MAGEVGQRRFRSGGLPLPDIQQKVYVFQWIEEIENLALSGWFRLESNQFLKRGFKRPW